MIKYNGKEVEYKIFAGGEVSLVDFNPEYHEKGRDLNGLVNDKLEAYLTHPAAVMAFFQVLESYSCMVERRGWCSLSMDGMIKQPARYLDVYLPYLPYARADREIEGEGFGLRMFAGMVSTYAEFISILYVAQAHNFAAAQIQFDCLLSPMEYEHHLPCGAHVLSPDLGASDWVREKYPEQFLGSLVKARTDNGVEIVGTHYFVGFEGVKEIVIVDDICDGGRTFIAALEYLRGSGFEGDVHLRVCHGIFCHKAKKRLINAGFTTVEATYDWTRGVTL